MSPLIKSSLKKMPSVSATGGLGPPGNIPSAAQAFSMSLYMARPAAARSGSRSEPSGRSPSRLYAPAIISRAVVIQDLDDRMFELSLGPAEIEPDTAICGDLHQALP